MTLEELKRNKKLLQILSVDTLTTRHSDELDFHELSVHQLVDAIELAYEEGYKHGQTMLFHSIIEVREDHSYNETNRN